MKKPRLTYANVMSTVAVFLALGGVSYAAVTLPVNSVGTKQVIDKSLSSADLATGSVTAASLSNQLKSRLGIDPNEGKSVFDASGRLLGRWAGSSSAATGSSSNPLATVQITSPSGALETRAVQTGELVLGSGIDRHYGLLYFGPACEGNPMFAGERMGNITDLKIGTIDMFDPSGPRGANLPFGRTYRIAEFFAPASTTGRYSHYYRYIGGGGEKWSECEETVSPFSYMEPDRLSKEAVFVRLEVIPERGRLKAPLQIR